MCGIAAGATKSSITQHFAVRGNIADLNAKEGTQETLVSLVGMLLGIIMARCLRVLDDEEGTNNKSMSSSEFFSWVMFLVLTLVHVWANYLGVKMLRLRTLNRERTETAFAEMTGICIDFVENHFKTYSRDTIVFQSLF